MATLFNQSEKRETDRTSTPDLKNIARAFRQVEIPPTLARMMNERERRDYALAVAELDSQVETGFS